MEGPWIGFLLGKGTHPDFSALSQDYPFTVQADRLPHALGQLRPLDGKFMKSRETFFACSKTLFTNAAAPTLVDELIRMLPGKAKTQTNKRNMKGLNTAAWDAVSEQVMHFGAMAQARAHETFARRLLETVGVLLVEASGFDDLWGAGYELDQLATTPRAAWGRNLQGRVLMRVRDTLYRERRQGAGGSGGPPSGSEGADIRRSGAG